MIPHTDKKADPSTNLDNGEHHGQHDQSPNEPALAPQEQQHAPAEQIECEPDAPAAATATKTLNEKAASQLQEEMPMKDPVMDEEKKNQKEEEQAIQESENVVETEDKIKEIMGKEFPKENDEAKDALERSDEAKADTQPIESPVKARPTKLAKVEKPAADDVGAVPINVDMEGDGEEEGEPPLATRVDQWSIKPKAKAKGKAKPKAAAKPKPVPKKRGRKPKTETVEVVESGDEKEEEDTKPASKASRKKRATSSGSKQPRAKAKAKMQPCNDESEAKANKESQIKYQPVTPEGKNDLESAYGWDNALEGEGKEECENGEGKAKNEESGETAGEPKADAMKERSFARRSMPKKSPAREKFLAIRDSFNLHLRPWLLSLDLPPYTVEAGHMHFSNKHLFLVTGNCKQTFVFGYWELLQILFLYIISFWRCKFCFCRISFWWLVYIT